MFIISVGSIVCLLFSIYLCKSAFIQLYCGGLFFISVILVVGLSNDDGAYWHYNLYIFLSNLFVLVSVFFLRQTLVGQAQVALRRETISAEYKALHAAPSRALIWASLACLIFVYAGGGPANMAKSWIYVTEEISRNTLLRYTALIAFIIALAKVLQARNISNLLYKQRVQIFFCIIMLISFVILYRVKLFLLPVILVLFYPKFGRPMSSKKMIVLFLGFCLAYLGVMFARWLGDLSVADYYKVADTYQSVMSAGLERELYYQFLSVMTYFETNDLLLGDYMLRYILLPVDAMFGTNLAPENSIYKYHLITYGAIDGLGGSAHPSIYADSYANFGWFGIWVPALYLVFFVQLEKRCHRSIEGTLILVTVFLSAPLIIRGSSFYGIYYLLCGVALAGGVSLVRGALVSSKKISSNNLKHS